MLTIFCRLKFFHTNNHICHRVIFGPSPGLLRSCSDKSRRIPDGNKEATWRPGDLARGRGGDLARGRLGERARGREGEGERAREREGERARGREKRERARKKIQGCTGDPLWSPHVDSWLYLRFCYTLLITDSTADVWRRCEASSSKARASALHQIPNN